MPKGYWVGPGPSTNKLKKGSEMVLASTSVHMVERAPQNGYHLCSCPQGELRLPPASPGGSPRQQEDLIQVPFKLLLLPWVPEHMRFCVCLLRVESPSHSSLALLKVSPAGLQSQMFWGLVFPVQDPWLGSPVWESDDLLIEENLCNCNYSPILLPWGYRS